MVLKNCFKSLKKSIKEKVLILYNISYFVTINSVNLSHEAELQSSTEFLLPEIDEELVESENVYTIGLVGVCVWVISFLLLCIHQRPPKCW